MIKSEIKHMVQYGIWPNCPNSCDFCLLEEKTPYSLETQHYMIDCVISNLKSVDWNLFSYGISVLGGDIFYIRNKELQDHMMEMFKEIVSIIRKVDNEECKFSTVTNGIYEPDFLFRVLDFFKEEIGINKIDINFSYDLKYRYKNDEIREKVLSNINSVRSRYDYQVGVQMILTQYLINLWYDGKFDIDEFTKKYIPGCMLTFLYPHPIKTGKKLEDFFFNRKDFLKFIKWLYENYETHFLHFLNSTRNSAVFKYTGLYHKTIEANKKIIDITQEPILTNGKEIINSKCGHSILYKCYTDSDKCMLCDIEQLSMGV